MTRETGRPLRAAMSATVTIPVRPWVTRSPATAGSVPSRWALDHLLDGGAAFGQVLQEGQSFGRTGIERVVEAGLPPGLLRIHPLHSAQASVAADCARAIPLSCVSRWPSNVNSPDPWTSCSERDDTRISPAPAASASRLATMTVCPR